MKQCQNDVLSILTDQLVFIFKSGRLRFASPSLACVVTGRRCKRHSYNRCLARSVKPAITQTQEIIKFVRFGYKSYQLLKGNLRKYQN